MVEEAGADQRFHNVAQYVVAVRAAVLARLFAETEMVGKADLASDARASRPADERVETLG